MTPTIQSEWENYARHCYPHGMVPIQEKECRQAFFSGALVMLRLTSEISGVYSEDDAIGQIGQLQRELVEAGKAFSKPL